MPKVVNSLRLDASLWTKLAVLAKAQHCSRSLLVERLLSDAIGQEQMIVSAMANPVFRDAMTRAVLTPGVMKSMSEAMTGEFNPEQLKLFTEVLGELQGAGQAVEKMTKKHKPNKKGGKRA